MNISSAIVHARPGTTEKLQSRLSDLSGVEIHAATAEGKMIVTIENETDQGMVEMFERIRQLDDVMSASMVYHHSESDPEEEL